MNCVKRVFVLIVCLCLLTAFAGGIFPKAQAASEMTASEDCIAFLKSIEGFSKYPYYDYAQFTVGFGTRCPPNKLTYYKEHGITRTEADALLRSFLDDFEEVINKKLIDKYNITLTQSQFDALVSFSFNVGTSWITSGSSSLKSAILNRADGNGITYAFSLYCNAGGKYVPGLVIRRLCEANMYLNGVYRQKQGSDFGYVYYDANGGSVSYKVQGYLSSAKGEPAADAVRPGKVFLGWFTGLNDGTKVTELTSDVTGLTLFARWGSEDEVLEDSETTEITVTVTGDYVNVRSGPGTNYGIVGRAYKNQTLVISHVTQLTSMQWGKFDGGWICLDYTNYNNVTNEVNEKGPEITPETTPETIDGESDPNASVSNPVDKVVENVEKDNENGELYTEYEQSKSDKAESSDSKKVVGTVSVRDGLWIRRGPGTNYSAIELLRNGDKIEIFDIQTSGDFVWGKIAQGWVCMDYISLDESIKEESGEADDGSGLEENDSGTADIGATVITGKIKADFLRVRTGPGTDYIVTRHLKKNDRVEILEQRMVGTNFWGKISSGWISMDYVVLDNGLSDSSENENEIQQEAEQKNNNKEEVSLSVLKGKVKADLLRIRSGPGLTYSTLGYYRDGSDVLVSNQTLGDGTYWGKTNRGWISMDYVVVDSGNDAGTDSLGAELKTVIGDCLRIRRDAGTSYPIVGFLYYGDLVEVLEIKDVEGTVWGRVDRGWICMEYVQ